MSTSFDKIISDDSTIDFETFIDTLNVINKKTNNKIDKTHMIQFLVEKKLLMIKHYPSNPKEIYFEPYQKYMNYFAIRFDDNFKFKCVLKPKGVSFVYDKLIKDGNYEFPDLPPDFEKQLKTFIKKLNSTN